MQDDERINSIVNNILQKIHTNKYELTRQNYATFYNQLGITKRKGFFLLQKIDKLLNKNKITLWSGKEQRKKLWDFHEGEIITFRLKDDVKRTKRPPPKGGGFFSG
jgi:hypothetical protein